MGFHFSRKSPADGTRGLYFNVDPIGKQTRGAHLNLHAPKRTPDRYKLIEDDLSSATSETSIHEIVAAEPQRRLGHSNPGFAGLPVARQQTDVARTSNFAAPTDEVKKSAHKDATLRKFLHDVDRAGRKFNPFYRFVSHYVSARKEEDRSKKQALEQAFFQR